MSSNIVYVTGKRTSNNKMMMLEIRLGKGDLIYQDMKASELAKKIYPDLEIHSIFRKDKK